MRKRLYTIDGEGPVPLSIFDQDEMLPGDEFRSIMRLDVGGWTYIGGGAFALLTVRRVA
jgi:hypothetical protein